MKFSKEEIPQVLAHHEEAVRLLHKRWMVLDKQAIQFGIAVPPHIATELADLTQRIQAREDEIASLKSQSAADQVPVEEIEYQAMLAEEWDASSGRLKLAQHARLDWARVRLGITLERAQAMEHTVRVQLAEEIFDDLNFSYLPHRYSNVPQPVSPFDFDRLRKAIRLDLSTATRLFRTRLSMVQHHDITAIGEVLLGPHSVCRQDDSELYQRFLDEVKRTLA